ncbi:divalent metal cation transporter [Ramlibacter sp. G-1-2-2]|uniref:Divalent metal cation transporter n=1 Tax=Ramlibacter agri TaxID=2728837 RepID=A0A848H1B9_9BURK|nr:divalent metal cation transporter [Ramlibacter agri]NML43391.1 divalent metal cation transporter [Ramlibacter agri]
MDASTTAPPPARNWIGPGLVTGASDDDPSGIATYAQAGALFGTGMLWVMLFTFPLMSVVQIASAQVGRVTGRGLAANLAKLMPRWLLVPLLLLLFLVNAINIGADLAAMGEAAVLLFPGEKAVYALGFGVLSLLLQVFVPYSRYVNWLKWLTISLFAYVATAFSLHVPWGEVLRATLLPHLSPTRDFCSMLVAVLGTTISPYLFFWQSAQEVEEQRAAPDEQPVKCAPEQARKQLGDMRADTLLGMGASNTVGFFIILTSGLALAPHGIRHIDTAAQAAQALQPFAGHWAFLLFTLGIVGTGLLAIPVLAGSAGYALAECFAWRRGLERTAAAAPRFYGTIALASVIGICIALSHINPMHALVVTAILNGLVSVPVLAALMLLATNKALMGDFTIGRAMRVLGWATTVLMGLAAAGLLWTA